MTIHLKKKYVFLHLSLSLPTSTLGDLQDRKSESDIPGGDSAGKREGTVSEENTSKQDGKGSVDKEDKDIVLLCMSVHCLKRQ